MYAEHVPIIASAMRRSPEVFERGAMFAVLSARTQFVTVPRQLEGVATNGSQERSLWGWKIASYFHLKENKAALLASLKDERGLHQALYKLTRVPGLGIVKAAFVLQLMGFDIACLDTRNVEREGRDPGAFNTHGRKDGEAFHRLIARYISETGGKAQHYWDEWCKDVAQTYGATPNEISATHLEIVPATMRRIPKKRAPFVPYVK